MIDFVNINFSSNIDSVEIYNTLGQKVVSNVWHAKSGQIDMRNLPAGLYIIKLNVAGSSQSVKVIKK